MSRIRAFFIALLVFCLSGCGVPVAQSEPEIPAGTMLGERAIPLRGERADGDRVEVVAGGGEIIVLVFYRGGDCGLCRVQLQEIQRNLTAYRRQGARVIAVTLDTPAATREFLGNPPFDFDVLSVDRATFSEWGVLDAERGLVLPGTYILDENGVVRYRYIGRTAADRPRDAEVLTAIQILWGE